MKKQAETEARLACDAKVEVETQALLVHEAKALVEKERDEALTEKKQLTKELNHKLFLMSIPLLL